MSIYDCLTLDELASLVDTMMKATDRLTYELLIDKLHELELMDNLTLTDYAIDYGYGFIHTEEKNTPYGKFMVDRIYFTPDGIEFIIDEILYQERE